MTAVLKGAAADETRIRSIRSRFMPKDALQPDPAEPLRAELRDALAALAAAEARMAALAAECVEARREGEAEGRRQGRADADARSADALACLRDGIAAAKERFDQRLEAMERLAALVARESVAAMIGDPSVHADLVERALRNQLQAIEAASVIEVMVSPSNFSDDAALERLAAGTRTAVIADPMLASGECRIALRLGTLDVGPLQQWPRLAEALTELAAG